MMQLSNQPLDTSGSRRPACLLLHGLGAGVFEVCLLARFLQERGYPVRAFNFPGHEGQGPIMPASRWQQWYGAVEREFLGVRERYGTVAVLGFSTGGTLALHLAAQQPVAALVLLAPFLKLYQPPWLPVSLEGLVKSPLPYLIPTVPRLDPPIRDPQLRRLASQVRPYQTFSTWAVRSALDLIEVVKRELPQITAPTLIIQSPLDQVVDPQGSQVIYEQIGSDRKQLLWLKASDHIIGLDVERQEIFAAIEDFLLQLDPQPSSGSTATDPLSSA